VRKNWNLLAKPPIDDYPLIKIWWATCTTFPFHLRRNNSAGNDTMTAPIRGRVLLRTLGGLVLLLGPAGCGGDRTVTAPPLSPQAAAEAALAAFDANKDGFLDATELERCPPLKAARAAMDRDGDGRLSAREIADRLALYQASGIGLTSVGCEVFLDGSPLAGAKVTLTPEAFLGAGFKAASGVSDEAGHVALKVEGNELPGLPCGLYRISVTRADAAGKETIPARYNAATTLGWEISPDTRQDIALRLLRR
jgi:hypothetical protein